MLMIIFGAGASYDSAQAYPMDLDPHSGLQIQARQWRPPLAKDLFLDPYHAFGGIVDKYPKLTHILPYLRDAAKTKNVEDVLESLQAEGKDSPESLREFASVRFYLCELIHKIGLEWNSITNGATNYVPLIREVLRHNPSNEPVCLVTFNYDLLLERALYTFEFRQKAPTEHLDSHPTLKLFKLHGSVNWSRLANIPGDARLPPSALIDEAPNIHIADTYVLANATDSNDMYKFPKPIVPAIAIPVNTKTDNSFECPHEHLDHLKTLLPHVTKVLLIGWQAREAHFIQLLRSGLRKVENLMVVAGDALEAEKIRSFFLEEVQQNPLNRYVGQSGFTKFITSREGGHFFKA